MVGTRLGRVQRLHAVYVMGGFYDDSKQVFSEACAWVCVRSFKKATSLPGVTVHHEYLYVVGEGNSGALKNIQKYDPQNDVWELVASVSNSRCAPCEVADENHVFAIDGMQENGEFLNAAEMYDPNKNTWAGIPLMDTARAFACGVAVKTNIFIIGSTDVLGQSALNTCEMYDTRTGVWAQTTRMYVPRFAAGIATVEGRVFVFGGGAGGESLESVESYSGETNEWKVDIECVMPRACTHIQCLAVRMSKTLLMQSTQCETNKKKNN